MALISGGGGSGVAGYLGYVSVQEQQASGVAGGGFTAGSYVTRVLNTKVTDTHSDCTLAANQMTLAAGTYNVRVCAPAFNCDTHKARLRNVTDGTTVILGANAYASSTGAGMSHSIIQGQFTIAASKALEVQHQCGTTRATNGLGVACTFGDTETYTIVEFWRVS